VSGLLSYFNWRATAAAGPIQLAYPFAFLFIVWLLLKAIEWLTNDKGKKIKK
jgi:hypothetical protein